MTRENRHIDPQEIILAGMRAGFMIGYRAAQLDAKDQGKEPPVMPKRPLTPSEYSNSLMDRVAARAQTIKATALPADLPALFTCKCIYSLSVFLIGTSNKPENMS